MAEELIRWSEVFELAGISEDDQKTVEFNIEDLKEIYYDFLKLKEDLNSLALYFVNQCLAFPKVHSVRYRIKDPYHLLAKVIRKNRDNPDRNIKISNYRSEITDLIGIRILHLFKQDFKVIDRRIRRKFELTGKELPIVYYRTGDDTTDIDKSKFQEKEHKRGYRSIHYIVESTPTKQTNFIEIQVRTIFEEAWSEIDHNLLYPENINDILLGQFSMILNGLAGSGDAMASLMIAIKDEREDVKFEHEKALLKKDKEIQGLTTIINKSNLSADEKEKLLKGIDPQIKRRRFSEILKELEKNQKAITGISTSFL